MRLLLKLSAAVALAVAMQCGSSCVMAYLDELQFTARVGFADATGARPDSPALLDAADRLFERQRARTATKPQPPATPPSLAWSISGDGRADWADSS